MNKDSFANDRLLSEEKAQTVKCEFKKLENYGAIKISYSE